jgi:hypothetical protein
MWLCVLIAGVACVWLVLLSGWELVMDYFVMCMGAERVCRAGWRTQPALQTRSAPIHITEQSITRSHPDKSTSHTHATPAISTHSHILHKQSTTQISGTQSSNSTKHGIWAPWGWSNEWTEICRDNVTKRFFNSFFSVLNVNMSWCFKVYKCMSWNKQQCKHSVTQSVRQSDSNLCEPSNSASNQVKGHKCSYNKLRQVCKIPTCLVTWILCSYA